jgi:HEAT repeat protein
LEDPNPIVAANAGIALARFGDRDVAGVLAGAVGNLQLAPPVRCAAAETLGWTPPATVLLQRLVDEEADRPGSGYSVAVHGELVRSLGRRVRPADEPRLMSALTAPADEVKLAALDVWQQASGGPLPVQCLALQNHRDPRIRARFLPVLAQHPSSGTLDRLTSALSDPDVHVRCAALRAMGMLGDERAVARLEPVLSGGVEAERIAAVRALADLRRPESVAIGARDKEWRVRLAVAEVLPDLPGEADVALAERLLDDASAEVQHRTVAAICRWPPATAEPLLLEVLGKCTYRSQKLAAESLAAGWPEGRPLLDGFPFGQPLGTRAPALAQIRQAYAERSIAPGDCAGRTAPSKISFSAEQLASVTASLQLLQTAGNDAGRRAEALANLRRFDAALVDMLEYLVDQRGIVLPESVFGELLATGAPDFAAVEQLGHSDVQSRRRAARQLAESFARRRPRTLLIHRLADLAVTETDAAVWQYLLAAIAEEDDDPTFRLVYAASCHESSGVRQVACEHLGRHPRPQHAAVLLATLDKRSEPVTCAAVAALGLCGRNVDPIPIVELLGSRSELVQIAAAATLTRLDRPEGPAALQRLAYSRNEQTRLRVAQVMGELARAEFAPALIRLLDDRHGIRLAALHSLPEVADCREAEVPGLHESDRVEAWRRWAACRGI